jgi:adenine/guanine phosphoribosyltransferase-like PRPP-binding protein
MDMNMESMHSRLSRQEYDKTCYESKDYRSKREEGSESDREHGRVLDDWEETEALTKRLIFELKESIISGEYSGVIGLDSSGRIPTLYLSRVIKNVYKKEGIDKQLQTHFFAGKSRFEGGEQENYELNKENNNEAFNHLDTLSGDRVVLVDDFLSSGKSISGVADELRKRNITFDIVVLGMGGYKNHLEESFYDGDYSNKEDEELSAFYAHKRDLIDMLGARDIITIFAGGDIPHIYGKNQAGGVLKENGGLYAKSIPKKDQAKLNLDKKKKNFLGMDFEWGGEDIPVKNIYRKLIQESADETADELLKS